MVCYLNLVVNSELKYYNVMEFSNKMVFLRLNLFYSIASFKDTKSWREIEIKNVVEDKHCERNVCYFQSLLASYAVSVNKID